MKDFEKLFFVFILITFLALLFSGFCFAQRELEIKYPELGVPGVETPTTTKTILTEYIRYIFTFAIIVAGLLAFGALIYGGIRYLTSAGDPTKMADARAQATAGILGLIILLSSYLILNTINPQLVLPKKPPIASAEAGIRIYTMDTCQEDNEHPSFKITQNMKDLTDPDLNWGLDGRKIKSIKFLGNPGDLTISLWSDIEFKGTETRVDYPAGDTNPCKQSGPDFPLATYKSISLDWHIPGVYLYAEEGCKGDYKIYQSSSATLPDFDNKTKSIKFIYSDKDPGTGEYKVKYAAILHEKENFMGEAMLFDQNQGDVNCKNLSTNLYGGPTNISVSSITVYLKPVGAPIGQGVRFWGDKNYTKEKDKYVLPSKTGYYKDGNYDKNLDALSGGSPVDISNADDKISSMEMDGHYVALLFRDPDYRGDCEVFMSSDPDFRDNRIGQCGFLGRSDCLSSFIIKARK